MKENKIEALVNRFWKETKGAVVKETITQEEKLDITRLREISISSSSVDIEVIIHDKPHIDILFTTYEDGPEMTFNHSSDKLEITAKKIKSELIFFGIIPSCRLQLFVPSNIADTWNIHTGSGDATISNVIANEFSVHSSSGDLEVSELKGQNAKLRSSSGDVIANGWKVEECQVYTSSGDITLKDVYSSRIHGKANSGDILITDLQGENVELETSSGDIDLKDITASKATVRASSGDITVNRVQAEMLVTNSTSGDTEVKGFSGSLKVRVTSGDIKVKITEECTLNLDSSSGDISVAIEKEEGLNAAFDVSSSGDIITNLPLQLDKQSKRLTGVTGDGRNAIRLSSRAGDVKVFTETFTRV